jgi:hypothetical protein
MTAGLAERAHPSVVYINPSIWAYLPSSGVSVEPMRSISWSEVGVTDLLDSPHQPYSPDVQPLRYSINVTLDGCCDHRAIIATEDLHRHALENLDRADALLFGRVTYELMETGWRQTAPAGSRPEWTEPFARKIDAARKYVVSSTLDRVDWNAELVRGDLGKAV